MEAMPQATAGDNKEKKEEGGNQSEYQTSGYQTSDYEVSEYKSIYDK